MLSVDGVLPHRINIDCARAAESLNVQHFMLRTRAKAFLRQYNSSNG